jgi:hypothetical protein
VPKKEALFPELTSAFYFLGSFHQIRVILNIETEITAVLLL